MKIFKKQVSITGRRVHILLFGIKIASYNMKNNDADIHGTGNIVQIPKSSNIMIHIYGNNNKVIVEEGVYAPSLSILIGVAGEVDTNNCTIHIGKNFTSGGGFVHICEDNTTFEIGEDCMFSDDIHIWASDTHSILSEGKCLNIGKYIKLGKHVWLGYGVTILKNTIISDNSIVGARSVVGGVFDQKGSIIAGNPAKVVRTGINWDRRSPKRYTKQNEKIHGK